MCRITDGCPFTTCLSPPLPHFNSPGLVCLRLYMKMYQTVLGQLGKGKTDGVGEGRSRYSYLGGGCDHSATMPVLAMHLIGRCRS